MIGNTILVQKIKYRVLDKVLLDQQMVDTFIATTYYVCITVDDNAFVRMIDPRDISKIW